MEAVTIKRITEEELAKELRIQYIQNPPEGMTSDEVRDMSDEDLLDMDYFLHEFDDIDDIKYACLESPNGCNMLLPSNARYCTQCGCMSTFYLQDVLSDYTEEFNSESDSKLKAI